MIREFMGALSAEQLKMRRTLALALVVVAPLAMVVLPFAAVVYQGPAAIYPDEGQALWEAFLDQTFNWWSLLMLPLFVTLETALVAGLDHADEHWSQLCALPVRRGSLYAAKLAMGAILIALSLVALVAESVLAGWALGMIFPEADMGALPLRRGVALSAMVFPASGLLIALHTFVAMRWRSFVVPSAFGIVMTVAGVMIINSDVGPYYPWVMPAMAMLTWVRQGLPSTQLLLGMGGGLVVALVGGWMVCRRDVL